MSETASRGGNGPRQRRRGRAVLLWLALLWVALFLGASEARAERWYVHYENAERALREERWRDAVEQLLQATERRADSGTRVRTYGMKVVDYFPYLRLGIAYHHLGQHAAALEAFDTEERLGVVRGSPAALSELERHRRLARAAREQTAGAGSRTSEEDQRAEVLRQSLEQARTLAAGGQLDEAMRALASGLAVAPDDAAALALMRSLREQVLARDRARETAAAAQQALQAARAHLAGGRPEQAASLLRQVLAAGPNAEASDLLARAQEAIAAAVESGDRADRIAGALAAGRRLAGAGRTADALAELELVLALEPRHREAAELRAELLTAQGEAQRRTDVDERLAAARAHLAAGRLEAALSAANLVLAVERGDPRALELVRQAYAGISRRVLAGSTAGNVPPAIRFADLRQDVGGVLAERVRDATFRLTGVAIDGSPAAIVVRDAAGRPLAASSRSQRLGDLHLTEFRVDTRLASGPTRLRVAATDARGLSSTSEYLVIYQPPWHRSPWLPIGVAAAGGAGAAALLLQRRRRHLRLRRRRFNPYVAGSPVFSEELFFGREPLLQRILQTIHTNSLLLHGERRIGKTSILHQLRRRLETLDDPEYRFFPVYVDLQGTAEDAFFATLADQIIEALAPVHRVVDRQPALGRAGGYGHHDLARELHDLLRALQERSTKRVKLVLLIDEVDELNHYDPRVNQKLRGLFMKRFAESLVAVVAGVQIRKEWEKETSPWYNFFEEVRVESIAAADARELVLRPLRGVFKVEPGAAERIAELAGGRPYLIQRYCLTLVNRLHEEGRRTLTRADVETLAAGDGGSGSGGGER